MHVRAVEPEFSITQEPQDVVGKPNEVKYATVSAAGNNLSYQWFWKDKNDEKKGGRTGLPGGQTSTLTLPVDEGTHAHLYYCKITNSSGNVLFSRDVSVDYLKTTELSIDTEPQDVAGIMNSSKTASVIARGEGLSYQWYWKDKASNKGGKTGLLGGQSSTITLPIDAGTHSHYYYCIITDKYGDSVTSRQLSVSYIKNEELKIIQQPEDVNGTLNAMTTSSVRVTGDGLSFQWYWKDKKSNNGGKTGLSGGRTSVLHLPIDAGTVAHYYYCIVTDKYGDSVVTRSISVSYKKNQELKIIQQPKDVNGTLNSIITSSVRAAGDGLSFQWYWKDRNSNKGGKTGLSGGRTSELHLPIDAGTVAHYYYCIVTDKYGDSVVTRSISVSYKKNQELKIVTQPSNVTGKLNEIISANVTAQGDGLSYQWYWKDKNSNKGGKTGLSGGRTSELHLPIDVGTYAHYYYCLITDEYGDRITSDYVQIIPQKNHTLAIIDQPKDVAGKLHSNTTTHVVAQGDDLTYQWYWKDKTSGNGGLTGLQGGKTDTLVLPVDRGTEAHYYYCIVTDVFGDTISTDNVSVSRVKSELRKEADPIDVSGILNSTQSTTVAASGDYLTYKWFWKDKNGTNGGPTGLAGYDTPTLLIPIDAGTLAHYYYCIVTDDYGNSFTTRYVNVTEKVSILVQPSPVIGQWGAVGTSTVIASGDGLKYQWYWQDRSSSAGGPTGLPGGQTATLSLPIDSGTVSHYYYCVVTDQYGNTATSNKILVSQKLDAGVLAIDVSHWQNTVDWSQVSQNVSFAILKLGGRNLDTGNYTDPKFFVNYKNAKANGMSLGVYFYTKAQNADQAREEAYYTLNILRQAGGALELPIFIDIEDSTQQNLSNAQRDEIVLAFCSVIQNAGYKAGVYSSHNWIKNYMSTVSYPSSIYVWIARYNKQLNTTKNYYTGRADMWQFTNSGNVNGISGNVDMSYIYNF